MQSSSTWNQRLENIWRFCCKDDLKRAFASTANHRGSLERITDKKGILRMVAESPEMQDRWKNYAKQMPYARDIEFADTIKALLDLEQILE